MFTPVVLTQWDFYKSLHDWLFSTPSCLCLNVTEKWTYSPYKLNSIFPYYNLIFMFTAFVTICYCTSICVFASYLTESSLRISTCLLSSVCFVWSLVQCLQNVLGLEGKKAVKASGVTHDSIWYYFNVCENHVALRKKGFARIVEFQPKWNDFQRFGQEDMNIWKIKEIQNSIEL